MGAARLATLPAHRPLNASQDAFTQAEAAERRCWSGRWLGGDAVNEQLPVQLSFDVSLPERAQRIRDLVGTARVCIIEIGRELHAARGQIHGERQWEDWLDTEFGWSDPTAKKYISVAKLFGSPSTVTSNLNNRCVGPLRPVGTRRATGSPRRGGGARRGWRAHHQGRCRGADRGSAGGRAGEVRRAALPGRGAAGVRQAVRQDA
jgi:Protein of unknown function (DUF3102)